MSDNSPKSETFGPANAIINLDCLAFSYFISFIFGQEFFFNFFETRLESGDSVDVTVELLNSLSFLI